MNQDDFYQQMLHRLDIIIAVQLTMIRPDRVASVSERIVRLAELGLPPHEIGRLVGRKPNYVSAVLGSKRTRKTGKGNV
ncbi:MAG: hypothetical protein ACRD2L_04330 [Terriglobia bacterium]